ncbi:MAG: ElyC/SanA/YdcF family protein [Campylobacterota bacterium]|nr:ElyC/SanA/YdcF family protein [Campylobacterota bacterium]
MGFVLKKIVAALIMPLPFFTLVGLIGLWFLYRNRIKKAKIFLTLSFVGIMLFSYSPISNGLIHTLEAQYQAPKDINTSIEYALLLGGDFERRAYGILQLYHQNPNLKIITSGYAGREDEAEAFKNKDRLIQLGIPASSIITHPQPKDTYEEAMAMKQLLNDMPFYLVTSASHMPRAMSIFQKQETNPIAIPSGYLERKTLWLNFVKASDAHKSETAWHEYIGSLWIKLKTLL